MKICGIIAEYNPFHEGHAYQIREARRLSGADAIVVVMSGHFVQRGEPAITDPYARAEAALKAGADAIFMMPPNASTASAEGFAAYGVSVLDALGCDSISCGIEPSIHNDGRDDVERLKEVAAKLADEDAEVGESIRSALKSGVSYPAALAQAVGVDRLGPNSILAVEYLKAMRRMKSDMDFVPVVRVGSGYNDTEVTEGQYPSATALRRQILGNDTKSAELNDTKSAELNDTKSAEPHASESCHAQDAIDFPIGPDDVMPMIIESIRNHMDELEDFADCSPQIAARIRNSRLHYSTFEEMVTDIKTKDVTYTRVARALTHILLGVRQPEVPKSSGIEGVRGNCTTHAQLIGFSNIEALSELARKSAQKALQGDMQIDTNNTSQEVTQGIEIISKAADYKEILAKSAYAAEIYNQALWNKYHMEGKDFFRQKILKI